MSECLRAADPPGRNACCCGRYRGRRVDHDDDARDDAPAGTLAAPMRPAASLWLRAAAGSYILLVAAASLSLEVQAPRAPSLSSLGSGPTSGQWDYAGGTFAAISIVARSEGNVRTVIGEVRKHPGALFGQAGPWERIDNVSGVLCL